MKLPQPTSNIEDEKVVLIEGLDEGGIEWKPYLIFIELYIFNATLALPFFILKMFCQFFIVFYENLQVKKFRNAFLTIIYYFLDLAMALSVLSMYFLAFFSELDLSMNYEDWAISCLIFLQSQILMSSYMQTLAVDKNQMELKYLVSDQNMTQLGLGRLAKLSIQKATLDIKKELQDDFFDFIRNSMKTENIDSTLYYFALEADPGILNIENLQTLDQQKLNQYLGQAQRMLKSPFGLHSDRKEFEPTTTKEKILQQLRIQGFRGYRHLIDNFMYPHYEYTKLMSHTKPLHLLLLILLIIFMKGVFPAYMIFYYSEKKEFEIVLTTCFMFMYLNMISLLIGLVVNDDLKGKRYILNVLQTMIVPNKPIDQDMDDDDAEEELPLDLPYNTKYKLDLSCNLSLESWDNMRRLTLLIDMEKQEFNEATFSFLAVYFLYTYINLSSVFLQFDLIPVLKTFFKQPILEWNMVLDFILIALLFLNRVYQGTLYNETFKNIQESIKKIEIVYDDKKALFDFYFGNNMMENIQNQTYRRITQNIYCAAADRVLYGLANQGISTIPVPEFLLLAKSQSKQKVNQLCATMTKVTDQIKFDSEHFSHKMLGVFRSNIWSLISTFGFLIYVFFHSKIKQYMNKHKIKQK